MTEQTAMTVAQNDLMAMPIMSVAMAVQRRNMIVELVRQVMVKGTHYGAIPGTDKETLLKAGAEMLSTFFGLSPRFVCEEQVTDWTGAEHGGEAFFYYRYRCQLKRGDVHLGEGIGSCNSWEKKYRYRRANIKCPACGAEAISRSRYPPRGAPDGTPPGWWCRECKADFAEADQRITDQPRGQVPNQDPADIVNTIDKMAQKRALVAATLIAVNASEFFTQDMEDFDTGDIINVTPTVVTKPPEPTQTNATPEPQTEGTATLDSTKGAVVYVMRKGKDAGLTKDEIHEALGVDSAKDFIGTATQAVARLQAWVTEQSDAEPKQNPLDEAYNL